MNPLLYPHGGTDATGPVLWDYSTNSNACGPCPEAVTAVQQADASGYPDPSYYALRQTLAQFHGVAYERIVIAASASEFIWRITTLAARYGAQAVSLPAHSYGDYAQAAEAWQLTPQRRTERPPHWSPLAALHWACEPSSPLGLPDPLLHTTQPPNRHSWQVLDCAYRPLQLDLTQPMADIPAHFWQLWSPNKSLGLTGVRAAYAIAPEHSQDTVADIMALACSWPVGAHGVALLNSWVQPATQRWLGNSLNTLRRWKSAQYSLCQQLCWPVLEGSMANYLVAQPPTSDLAALLAYLRTANIQLRDCTSFGLPGWVRLGVLPPAAQQALQTAYLARPMHLTRPHHAGP